MSLPDLVNNACSACGSADMMLAEDYTKYSPCEHDEKKGWVPQYTHEQAAEAEDAVRFYCTECGEYHAVPKELL